MEIVKNFGTKKVGYSDFHVKQPFNHKNIQKSFSQSYYIIFMNKGSTITIDFITYNVLRDSIYFINRGQPYEIPSSSRGRLVVFNPEFYCIAFHDKELTCDGILFNNIFETPSIELSVEESENFTKLIEHISNELLIVDSWAEEMIRTKLKELIINASRSWIRKNPYHQDSTEKEGDLSRKFSQLVELNYHMIHTVSGYADLLYISPKTLNRRISKEKNMSPSTFINKRIVLQAQRLLANTTLTVKEISAQLGYNDQSYFIRFFKTQTGSSPQELRKKLRHYS